MNEEILKLVVVAVLCLVVVAVAIPVFLLISVGTEAVNRVTGVTSSGSVYSGEGLSVSSSSIKWGQISAKSSSLQNITVTNNLDSPGVLSFSLVSWSPDTLMDFVELSWNYNGSKIPEKMSREIVFNLTALPNLAQANFTAFTLNIRLEMEA